MPVLKDEDFVLPAHAPPPKRRRGNRIDRLSKEPGVDKPAIARAVSYLDEAAAGAVALTNEIRQLAAAAKALLDSGLTENALCLLIQDLGPKAHGRPIPKETILGVLKAAARVEEHLR